MINSYGTLFFWSFLAATVVPMSSEPPLIYLISVQQALVLPVLVGTLGNVLGACTTYWVSLQATGVITKRKKPARGRKQAAKILQRYGQAALLLSWVPILGDALVALAGVAKMSFGIFCFWVTLGKGLRYLVIALVTLNFL